MYSKNILTFFTSLLKDGTVTINLEDEVCRDTLVTRDGQVVNESTQTIAPTGDARTEFHISKPDGWPSGKYKLEVFLNGSSAATKDFEVGQ